MHTGTEERIAFLRKRFREGDRFEATVVRYLSPHQALIRIEGRGFTAWMHSSTPAGCRVEFVVDRLVPEVVLRECTSGGSGINLYI